MKKKIAAGLKAVLIVILAFIVSVLLMHGIGSAWNKRVPNGGINESMFVDINGTKQWINIYGKSKDNPVLLYLHGGPGSSTSEFDYAFTRKWSDIYTVVTWDQRNCGKSYTSAQNDTALTKALFMEDGKQMTEFIRKYMGVDKITILGHSWGTLYGANLVQEYPEYYNLYIGTGQVVDSVDNEKALIEAATSWADGDEQTLQLIEKIDPNNMNMESIKARNEILEKCGYSMTADKADINPYLAAVFNPNYSIKDWISYTQRKMDVYLDFFVSDEFKSFSLKGKTKYEIPYININGDMDYQANHELAEKYFEEVQASQKEMFVMKNTRHGLLEVKSEEFSDIVHEIFSKYKSVYK